LTALGAYLLGSIPTGFLVAKAKGIDIRNVGSGNIGATNAMRVLGKPAGIFVLLVDCAKGFVASAILPVLIVMAISSVSPDFPNPPPKDPVGIQIGFQILAGIFAVLGHNYTCWLKFKGGKGIATTAGVYLALAPWPLLIALAAFILAATLTRYMSVGSIAGAVALPAAVWISQPHNYFLGVVTTMLGALAIYKHKSNIQRLMAGTENRLGKKSVGRASSLSQTPNPNEKNGDRQDACPAKSEDAK
jgi:glycerol-3-phosphate acyltransferase PlsY